MDCEESVLMENVFGGYKNVSLRQFQSYNLCVEMKLFVGFEERFFVIVFQGDSLEFIVMSRVNVISWEQNKFAVETFLKLQKSFDFEVLAQQLVILNYELLPLECLKKGVGWANLNVFQNQIRSEGYELIVCEIEYFDLPLKEFLRCSDFVLISLQWLFWQKMLSQVVS